jgi:hypothetical protein
MKDNSQSLSEFEKALIRKSGECDELYFKVQDLQATERERLEAMEASPFSNAAESLLDLQSRIRLRTPSPAIAQAGLTSAKATINDVGNSAGLLFKKAAKLADRRPSVDQESNERRELGDSIAFPGAGLTGAGATAINDLGNSAGLLFKKFADRRPSFNDLPPAPAKPTYRP